MTAYLDALKMLARRELSETQVRQRLARRGHADDAIDAAVGRLKEERAIDDARAAEAIARTQTAVRGRGKLRVRRQIESAGIPSSVAQRVADNVFDAIDADALLDAAFARRLRGRTTIADRAEAARLYRYLVGQGFEPEAIMKRIRQRMKDA